MHEQTLIKIYTETVFLLPISWRRFPVFVSLIPRRWWISVLGGVVVVVVALAVCIRVQKFVNHLTYCWVPSFQRVRVHCRALPNTRCFVLVQTVLLHCFYSLHTIFVASRQLYDGDNNKGRREKSNWRHWPCSPIGWYYVTRREQRETLNYIWVS
jgi:hypothetical protein